MQASRDQSGQDRSFAAELAAETDPRRDTAGGRADGGDGDLVVGRRQFAIFTALLAAPLPPDPRLARLLGSSSPALVGGREGADAGSGPPLRVGGLALLPLGSHASTRRLSVDGFDCGVAVLNEGLRREAAGAPHQPPEPRRAGLRARCCFAAVASDGHVAGYFSLRSRCVRPAPTESGMKESGMKGSGTDGRQEKRGVPIVVLARLAVDRSRQGGGLGAGLLGAALLHGRVMAEDSGARAVFVHALDADVKPFYLRHGLRPAPAMLDPLGVLVTVGEIGGANVL